MKIAAIYWPTSSVGGIETALQALHAEATRRGHEFHVLRSGLHDRIAPGLFGERKRIRGGDTYITIDGEAPHSPKQIKDTLRFLRSYDRLYFAFLCPHPTKAYGRTPHFLPLYNELNLPMTSRITDGYFDSYRDWGIEAVEASDHVTVSQPAYRPDFGYSKISVATLPFNPHLKPGERMLRNLMPLTVWTSQWKAIKGIHKLLPYLGEINGAIELYSCGILYYQLRSTDDWFLNIKRDLFKGYNGIGKANYYGWKPLKEISQILTKSWFMIDLQGISSSRYKAYQDGSINNTTVEALYYGSIPVLARQATKAIPEELALFVDQPSGVPGVINRAIRDKLVANNTRRKRAKQYVLDNWHVSKLYDKIIFGED